MISRRTLLAASLFAPAALLLRRARCALADAPAPSAGCWRPRASVPWPVQEVYGTVRDGRVVIAGGLAAAALGHALYAFGGEELGIEGPDGVIGSAWSYDPATDTWDPLPDMITPRHGLAATALGDSIFAIGGGAHTGIGRTTAVVEAFTPVPPAVPLEPRKGASE